MPDPLSLADLNERQSANMRIEGFGFDGITISLPCPFCGAPDNLIYKLYEVEQAVARGASCKECNRSWRVRSESSAHSTTWRIFLTAGPDLPAFMSFVAGDERVESPDLPPNDNAGLAQVLCTGEKFDAFEDSTKVHRLRVPVPITRNDDIDTTFVTSAKVATHGVTPGLEEASAPGPINPATGQHTSYWVLSEEERSKGFIRPHRTAYRHEVPRPQYALHDLTAEESSGPLSQWSYVKFEAYPSDAALAGRYWTQQQLERAERGCGAVTTMSLALSQTYARNPKFYGSTFCSACRTHFPVGEFRWVDDGQVVGS